jgi:hypothetical protein
MILTIPLDIKKVFNNASEPVSPEERLWRERAARMTLDALGHTNLTMKPKRHDEAVKYARRWFRGLFEDAPKSDSAVATFDAAGLIGFPQVRNAALSNRPYLFEDILDESNT